MIVRRRWWCWCFTAAAVDGTEYRYRSVYNHATAVETTARTLRVPTYLPTVYTQAKTHPRRIAKLIYSVTGRVQTNAERDGNISTISYQRRYTRMIVVVCAPLVRRKSALRFVSGGAQSWYTLRFKTFGWTRPGLSKSSVQL